MVEIPVTSYESISFTQSFDRKSLPSYRGIISSAY